MEPFGSSFTYFWEHVQVFSKCKHRSRKCNTRLYKTSKHIVKDLIIFLGTTRNKIHIIINLKILANHYIKIYILKNSVTFSKSNGKFFLINKCKHLPKKMIFVFTKLGLRDLFQGCFCTYKIPLDFFLLVVLESRKQNSHNMSKNKMDTHADTQDLLLYQERSNIWNTFQTSLWSFCHTITKHHFAKL